MAITQKIREAVMESLTILYGQSFTDKDFQINLTKPEFEGDYTIVLFALVKSLRKSPDGLGQELGSQLISQHTELFSSYNIIKGFLNLVVSDNYWQNFLLAQYNNADYGKEAANGKKIMVEYSSPNTNKPLHLGHLRNNFLGWSMAEIFKATGYDVAKTCIVNDRGIHICKSMLAWQRFGNGATPQSTGLKGDHLVGDYYVKFENELKIQTEPLLQKVRSGNLEDFEGEDKKKLQLFLDKLTELPADKLSEINDEIKELARNNTPVMKEVRQMLLKWEDGDPDTIGLWKEMNSWVYAGFDETYQRIGSDFDKIYYESNTYLLGKDLVEQGLKKGVFFEKEDSSVWIDLTSDGLDQKIVRRRDGTSVYITQDIGLAVNKYEEYKSDRSIYVVGDEQNYHFKVLKLIAQKLGLPAADGIYHLSYGMVELPSGRMKSREGTVVDADDLVDGMVQIAEEKTKELGKVNDFSSDELKELYDTIGLGALKFFLLRVDPRKKMIFNPEESIDIHGFTGSFMQYTYARIKSILRKSESDIPAIASTSPLLPLEKQLVIVLEQFPGVLQEAAAEYDPSKVALYVFNLAQSFNSLYSQHKINGAESPEKETLRLQLAQLTAQVIKTGMGLLGIRVPERM